MDERNRAALLYLNYGIKIPQQMQHPIKVLDQDYNVPFVYINFIWQLSFFVQVEIILDRSIGVKFGPCKASVTSSLPYTYIGKVVSLLVFRVYERKI